MAIVYQKSKMLTDAPLHYCPGCTHGIIHKLVAESLEELAVGGKTVGVAPVGCSVMAYDYFACDMIEAAHGRAPATATGIKRCRPDNIVFTYQGDGDLASIGMAETVHAAARIVPLYRGVSVIPVSSPANTDARKTAKLQSAMTAITTPPHQK